MALNGIQIFKLTPKKNCKECGCPTCMAFSMKVAQGAMKIEQCPHMSEDALASLSEATAPPMKTIKIGTGAEELTLGGETVLFRHEKTFVNKSRYAVELCTCMDDAAVDAKLAEIPKVDYDRIGERMYAELVYVNCDAEATADKYTALVQKAAALGRTMILGCSDPEIAKAALEVCKDNKPVLNGANASNYEAMNAVATAAGVVLGVSGKDLNELYDTTAALEKLGNKNLVLDVTVYKMFKKSLSKINHRPGLTHTFCTFQNKYLILCLFIPFHQVIHYYPVHIKPSCYPFCLFIHALFKRATPSTISSSFSLANPIKIVGTLSSSRI